MDLGFGPDERPSVFVISLDESIDMLPQLRDRSERGAMQRLSFQDREPDFDLVEPGRSRRREVEVHVRMALEPAVVSGLVGVEVVEHDVDRGVGMGGNDIVHEVEELYAPAARFVRRPNLAGGYLEGSEQRGGTVALVVMAVAGQRPAARELQIALRALQC